MTNLERIVKDGDLGLLQEMRKGDNKAFCDRFGVPMRADGGYDLEPWLFDEYQEPAPDMSPEAVKEREAKIAEIEAKMAAADAAVSGKKA